MLSVLLVSYGLVFGAEVVGDKTLYTIGTLATRYRLLPILFGSTIAFMLKMSVAVLLGQAITHLPGLLVTTVSAATFFIMATVIWFQKPEVDFVTIDHSRSGLSIAVASFAGIFFFEWGDVGQLAAATLAARYRAPRVVWLGAVLAMMTKGVLALTLGASLRRRVPRDILRCGTSGLCMVMGILAVLRIG